METPNDKSDEIKKTVNTITTDIKNQEKQLEEIRKECQHPAEEVKVKLASDGGNTRTPQPRKVCGICGKIVGYPSPEEISNEFEEKKD